MVDTPREWSCDNDNKRVKVEVLVDENINFEEHGAIATGNLDQYEWVEIPTTKVEVNTNRNGVADINRYARVDFPTEWAGESVVKYINGYNPNDPEFSYVRIWFKDAGGEYVLDHFGFAGGVGPASATGVSKMWVYDINELMKAVSASVTYNTPTPMDVLADITSQMNRLTGVFLRPVLIAPNTEEELADFIRADDDLFFVQDLNEQGGTGTITYSALDDGELTEEEASQIQEDFEIALVDTGGLRFDVDLSQLEFNVSYGQKSFQPNRDTLIDVLDWLAGRMDAKWHLEPFANGVRIVMDVRPTSRTFIQDAVATDYIEGRFEEEQIAGSIGELLSGEEVPVHGITRLIKNSALADILPASAVVVRGETSRSLSDRARTAAVNTGRHLIGGFARTLDFIDDVTVDEYEFYPEPAQPSRRYPEVQARVRPFYERSVALGNEEAFALTSTVVESSDTTTGAAERTAIRNLKKRVAEAGEGEIVLFGNPRLMPYDRMLAYPTCRAYVPNALVPPIGYEIQEVTHVAEAGEQFKTTAEVSVFVSEEDVEIVSSRLVQIGENNAQ